MTTTLLLVRVVPAPLGTSIYCTCTDLACESAHGHTLTANPRCYHRAPADLGCSVPRACAMSLASHLRIRRGTAVEIYESTATATLMSAVRHAGALRCASQPADV